MKLEPVAWQFRFKAKLAEWRGCSSGDALLYGNMAEYETRELYAIPEGYVMAPVEPTEAMVQAAYKGGTMSYSEIYRIMLAAAKEQS